MNGYASREYAESFMEFGTVEPLANSGGFYLRRGIPDDDSSDGMSCYPLFACRDWSSLEADMRSLEGTLVSLTAVVSPLAAISTEDLHRCFPDLVVSFKNHYLVDYESMEPTAACLDRIVSRHHRYYARRALRQLQVHRVENPAELLDDWIDLYGHLIERHKLRGLHAFSPRAFDRQLRAPGMVAFRASRGERTVAAQLWYHDGDVACSHLFAANEAGYESNAAYALYWHAMGHFAGRARWLNLGGAAGAGNSSNGLDFFKRGWSNVVRPALLCGRILDRERYRRLCRSRPVEPHDYFPAYRQGELAGGRLVG